MAKIGESENKRGLRGSNGENERRHQAWHQSRRKRKKEIIEINGG